jgi:transcriptional regulator GlxA family with amidase domain
MLFQLALLPIITPVLALSFSSFHNMQIPRQTTNVTDPPMNYGILIFPNFQSLDVFGPLDVLNNVAYMSRKLKLSIIAHNKSAVSTKPVAMNTYGSDFGESIVPTHTFSDPPEDLEVLIVPGGGGTRVLDLDATNPVGDPVRESVNFISETYPKLRYLLSVCTGAALVAKSGVLDGRNATTNKKAWAWATSQGPKVNWIPHARWTHDGNIWSSSGVSAGIDLTYAFVSAVYGEDVATYLANLAEYMRHTDPNDDPFSYIWNVTKPGK